MESNVCGASFKSTILRGRWSFARKVGELAEAEAHHPELLIEWGRTTVTWWTHKIKACTATISSWRRRRTSSISDNRYASIIAVCEVAAQLVQEV
jgi:hypothetical protein